MQWMVGISATVFLSLLLLLGEATDLRVSKHRPQWHRNSLGDLLGSGCNHRAFCPCVEKSPKWFYASFNMSKLSALFGYLVFGDGLDMPTIIGVSIIIASGLFVLSRK